MLKVVITGAHGLLGWHAFVRLHAQNCASRYAAQDPIYDIVALDRAAYSDSVALQNAVIDADFVLHFAGVNRADDTILKSANADIATRLLAALEGSQSQAHVVYANSVHSDNNSVYGRSKRAAGEILSRAPGGFTDLVLPHIFGECAKPDYNNITATIIDRLHNDGELHLDPEGAVSLLHAGEAADIAIDAGRRAAGGEVRPSGRKMSVVELHTMLQSMHHDYLANLYPELASEFEIALFNSYRAASYPCSWPRKLKLNSDDRGWLFEAVRSNSRGQTFLSETSPGITRGEHFHLNKVERFVVVSGDAIIRIRKVGSQEVWEYPVSGTEPVVVDMPTLHTHNIENVGNTDLLTMFWANELFDPQAPDTYADKVVA